GSSELGQHGVEVPDAIIDHERRRARTEVHGVRRERGPNRLLSSRGRRESRVGLLRFDGHAQVFAIPGSERLGIACFEEYAADSNYLLHANPFYSPGRTKMISCRDVQRDVATRLAQLTVRSAE